MAVLLAAGCGPATNSGALDAEPEQIPESRAHHGLAYDERRRRVVLYGGSRVVNGTGRNLSDYREFDGTRWLAPVPSGLERAGHRLVYDDAGGRLLLIGGLDSTGYSPTTFQWKGGRWEQIIADSTLAVAEPAVAYDRARRRVVLYGGGRPGGRPTGNTLELVGNRWHQVQPVGQTPGPLVGAGMAYDEHRKRVVLHGGIGPDRKVNGTTWEWDGVRWRQVAVDGPAVANMGFAYDAARRSIVLFGGATEAAVTVADTWTFDGTRWTRLAVSGPSRRGISRMVFDRTRGVTVLFGGRVGYPNDSNQTWEWDGHVWRFVSGDTVGVRR